ISTQAHLASRVEELEKKLGAQLALKNQRSNKECSNCGRKGHVKEDCYRKGGGKEGQFPSWWRGKRDTSTSANVAISEIPQHYAMMASSSGTGEVFADSAASDHFFRNRSDFVTY
ncbi:hypothetical protein C8R42DRAFT_553138, partial [Lentinula raphanica]